MLVKLKPKRRNKHGNKRVVAPDGKAFDSIGEYRRWQDLLLLEKAGHITLLEHHRNFPLVVGRGTEHAVTIGDYEADFYYWDVQNHRWVVEDVKAFDKKKGKFLTTDLFRWKAKHFEAQYGWRITLVEA